MKTIWLTGILIFRCGAPLGSEPAKFLSHPPLRKLPQPFNRPAAKGPAYYVHAVEGKDENSGSKELPWKTINHALTRIQAGDTLYLNGGVYYEHVYCSAAGAGDKKITIRSAPGELAVIDGSFRSFFESPSQAWEPLPGGAPGEYRSRKPFRNLRNVHGRFGDSMIGLQIYYYAEDLRGERYVGPGLWYDRSTGHIHVRLQHYKKEGLVRGRSADSVKYFPSPLHHHQSYSGETDPRKLPLIVAPFHSVPLLIDHAQHVRFQDLVVRGGGHDVVSIQYGQDVQFDNVVVYAGTYGLRARNTGPFRFHNSAIFGSVPPWSTRGETSLREYPWRKEGRDLTRLNTHALLIPDFGAEFSVYYFPYNNNWEISNSEFADAHDGVYVGDIDGLKFHHNYVHNFQDDGLYLSSFHGLHKPKHGPREIYQNVIIACLIPFAYGGAGRLSTDVHVYRNIIDGGLVVSDHGGPPWEGMRWYHNTIAGRPVFLFRLSHTKPGQTWQVFNNIILSGQPKPGKPQEGAAFGGNLGGDPKFIRPNHFQLSKDSPAIDAGTPIPEDWPDPLRDKETGKPDAGALPLGSGPLKVGRFGKYEF